MKREKDWLSQERRARACQMVCKVNSKQCWNEAVILLKALHISASIQRFKESFQWHQLSKSTEFPSKV
jgi:hypothetical protein